MSTTYLNVAENFAAASEIANVLSEGTATTRVLEHYEYTSVIFDFLAKVSNQNCKFNLISNYTDSKDILTYLFTGDYNSWNSCDPIECFNLEITNYLAEIIKTAIKSINSNSNINFIIWTDSLWKGRYISYEVNKLFMKLGKKIIIYKANISEYNQDTIQNALTNLEQLYPIQKDFFFDPIAVRKEIDLRTGAAFTRYQTMRWQDDIPNFVKYVDKLSYGSCLIPTLGFVVERYNESAEFVPESFWKLKVTHKIHDFNWNKNHLFDKDACEKHLLSCQANPQATVENVIEQVKTKSRPFPMNTAELLKLSSRKLKISFQDTMFIAKQFYKEGLISYPRTETNSFSSDPDINFRSLVEQHTTHPNWGKFAKMVLEWGPNPRNGNKSDQAHPPIHPTKLPTNRLYGKEAQVYELIVRHFLACVSKDATGSETIVNINIAGEKFHANGLVVLETNYLDVYPYEVWNVKEINKYQKGDVFKPQISMQKGETTGPSPLTEADLITLMEKHHIGTDATYEKHILSIICRKYIEEDDQNDDFDKIFLKPLCRGIFLYEGYNALNLELTKPNLRANFEKDLNEIRWGLKDSDDVLSEQKEIYKSIYQKLTDNISIMDEKLKKMIEKSLFIEQSTNGNDQSEINISTSMNSDDQLSDDSEGESSTVCGTCQDISVRPTKRKSRSSGSAEFTKLKSPKKE